MRHAWIAFEGTSWRGDHTQLWTPSRDYAVGDIETVNIIAVVGETTGEYMNTFGGIASGEPLDIFRELRGNIQDCAYLRGNNC